MFSSNTLRYDCLRETVLPVTGMRRQCYEQTFQSVQRVCRHVVPLFSILMLGEFSRRSVKETGAGAEVFSDEWRHVVRVVTNFSLHGVTVKRST